MPEPSATDAPVPSSNAQWAMSPFGQRALAQRRELDRRGRAAGRRPAPSQAPGAASHNLEHGRSHRPPRSVTVASSVGRPTRATSCPEILGGGEGLGEHGVRLGAQLEPAAAQRDPDADPQIARRSPARAAYRLIRRRRVGVGVQPQRAGASRDQRLDALSAAEPEQRLGDDDRLGKVGVPVLRRGPVWPFPGRRTRGGCTRDGPPRVRSARPAGTRSRGRPPRPRSRRRLRSPMSSPAHPAARWPSARRLAPWLDGAPSSAAGVMASSRKLARSNSTARTARISATRAGSPAAAFTRRTTVLPVTRSMTHSSALPGSALATTATSAVADFAFDAGGANFSSDARTSAPSGRSRTSASKPAPISSPRKRTSACGYGRRRRSGTNQHDARQRRGRRRERGAGSCQQGDRRQPTQLHGATAGLSPSRAWAAPA